MIIAIVAAVVVVGGTLVALALARAAALGDEALEAKQRARHRHWWDW